MTGIPGVLKGPLQETLMKCDVFHSDEALWNFFMDERLKLWQNDVSDAKSRSGRVENLVSILIGLHRQDGENALVLFLKVLAERYDGSDQRQTLLTTFADQLRWYKAIDDPSSVQRNISGEANPRSSSMLLIAEAEKMLECARSVARVEVQLYRDGKKGGQGTGTGWLIAPDLVLTCWHVIAGQSSVYEQPVEQADLALQLDNMLFTFDFTAAGRGLQYKVKELLIPCSETYETDLDFALLRLKDRQEYPLSRYGYLRLDIGAPLTAQTMLYIIQHPFGRHQQVACDTFEQVSSSPGRIRYKTLTEKGTSGAPILNRLNWRAIGLHNGESRSTQLREGTLIGYILSDLQAKKPDLYDEILAAHQSPPAVLQEPQVPREPFVQPTVVLPVEIKPALESIAVAPSQRTLAPLDRYLDEITQDLLTLQTLQKLFAPPRWSGWRKRTLNSDEGKVMSVTEQLVSLERSAQKLNVFFERLRSTFYTRRLSPLHHVHRFEEQLKDLHKLVADYYAGSEQRDEIYQKIKSVRKEGGKVKREIKSIFKDLEKAQHKGSIQSTEDQDL